MRVTDLFSSTVAKALGGISLALALATGIQTWRADHWHDAYDTLHGQAGVVLTAIQHATGEKAEWATAPGQIIALGETVRTQRVAIADTNQRIDQMAREAVRLRAQAAELQRIADQADAQKRSALKRLGDMAATPGTRSDCMTLLKEAEAALDIVREASQ
ncbi:MAG: hypothetical protein KKA12_03130 [Alphaproteobacteria bacterium]|nr:hypothetical protein [Alphaproteobacteria bacterium]